MSVMSVAVHRGGAWLAYGPMHMPRTKFRQRATVLKERAQTYCCAYSYTIRRREGVDLARNYMRNGATRGPADGGAWRHGRRADA